MRTEQLQYFVEVARLGSFSLAANQLHVAQPSISQAISNLAVDPVESRNQADSDWPGCFPEGAEYFEHRYGYL
jgi:hypothetical protein